MIEMQTSTLVAIISCSLLIGYIVGIAWYASADKKDRYQRKTLSRRYDRQRGRVLYILSAKPTRSLSAQEIIDTWFETLEIDRKICLVLAPKLPESAELEKILTALCQENKLEYFVEYTKQGLEIKRYKYVGYNA